MRRVENHSYKLGVVKEVLKDTIDDILDKQYALKWRAAGRGRSMTDAEELRYAMYDEQINYLGNAISALTSAEYSLEDYFCTKSNINNY